MMNKKIAAVVIGRNEGQRLVTCLESLLNQVDYIVYVDSGSSDNSVYEAESRQVDCLSLDLSIPFTAARARNEGVAYLIDKYPALKYIQFIDGDCELQPDWVNTAYDFLEKEPHYAVACGRRRERFPENSIYNQLCDIEWNTPVGDALACGGDALIRVGAFNQVEGYRDGLIAGEEPEMCFRLRAKAWKIRRLDAEMTLHDAAMTRFSQWWKRAKRAGHAYAESYFLHGRSAEKFRAKSVMSVVFWAVVLPVLLIALSIIDCGLIVMGLIYPAQVFRLSIKNKAFLNSKLSFYYAVSNVLGKFPQALGMMQFLFNKIKGQSGVLIEYK